MNIFWVSPSGAATWAAAESDTPLSGTACASIATANANIAAGKTVYLRGGTYYVNISPTHSGTGLANRIIYQSWASEVPLFMVDEAGGRWAIKLQGASWIKVSGISSYMSGCFFRMGYGSCYNEVSYCSFDLSSYDYALAEICWTSSAGAEGPGSNHNWIHHNSFSHYGSVTACSDIGTVRISRNYNDPSEHNTFEDNVFAYGGHDCMDVGGRYNVVRRNWFHNEQSYFVDAGGCANESSNGYFGNRCLLLSNSGENVGTAYHTLVEENRIGHSGMSPDDNGAHCIENAGCHSIIRYNDLYNAAGLGIEFKTQPAPSPGVTLKSGSWGRVYNNTIYRTGYGDADIGPGFQGGIMVVGIDTGQPSSPWWPWPVDAKFRNNINCGWHYFEFDAPDPSKGEVEYTDNWSSQSSDPGFINADITQPSSLTLPNLGLVAGSPCIQAGVPLTLANGAGTASTLLAVDDAYWFQDGTWGSDLSDIRPDWIAIGTTTNVVEIAAVNCGTKVITLASPMTWADNAPIWLYKNSSGVRVLYGTAPDIGAHPWTGAAHPDTALVVAPAAIALASSTPTLSPEADYTLVVAAAGILVEADSLSLVPSIPSPWDIRIGPLGDEMLLPPLNWPAGSRPEMPVPRRVHMDSVKLDNGGLRHNFRTNAPREWSHEWARVSAADLLAIQNMAAKHEPLHYQNRWWGTEWTWVMITDCKPVPLTGSMKSASPWYGLTLNLLELL